MDEDITGIENLILSPEFGRLVNYSKDFDLFETLGISASEIHHSRVLRFLLDPTESHGCGGGFIQSFLREAVDGVPPEQRSKFLPFLIGVDFQSARVLVEQGNLKFGYIDLVVEFPVEKVVVGIENKINALEREGQIEDYQGFLSKLYPDFDHKAVVFLTPTGREAATADPSSEVVLINTSYRAITEAVRSVKKSVSAQSRHFIEQFLQHLEETIVGSSELRNLAMQVWKNPRLAKAVKTLHRFRPHIDDDMRDKFEKKIDEYLKKNKVGAKDVTYYKSNGLIAEIKITLCMWKRNILPFTLLFYLYLEEDGSWIPFVRLVIWRKYLGDEKYQQHLRAFASNNYKKILEDYTEIPGWKVWGQVLANGNDPIKISKEGDIAENAADAAIALLERINPLVEKFEATDVK